MPFDEKPSVKSQKIGLKQVSSQKSMIDSLPTKPSQEDLDQKVKKIQKKTLVHQELVQKNFIEFTNMMQDKTLPENKTLLQKDMEKDIIRAMIELAGKINNDPGIEEQGEGSLNLESILLVQALKHRDKINSLEYKLSLAFKEINDLKNK